jgi:ABC-2 type transport system ATP-binding protein
MPGEPRRVGAPRVEVIDLSVRYGKRVALDKLSLAVSPGEIVGILGPNGAGKSTALLAIAGAIAPHGGQVFIDGVDARQDPLAARRRVGLCDQPPTMYEFFTVAEHVEFVAESRGHAGAAATRAMLEALSLTPVIDRPIRELSFGYRQRVGLAAALVGGTDVILLDETLNGLDPHAARAAREVLLSAQGAGATILMSTHLLGAAERLCTRLLFIDGGQLKRDVARAELEALLDEGGAGAIEALYLELVRAERA